MLDLLFASAAGVLTIASPCVLPMLPIILGASVGREDRTRPLLIVIGFALTFWVAAFAFGLFPSVLGLSQEALRTIAIVFLTVFGILMIWPYPFELLAARLSFLSGKTGHADRREGAGKLAALLLGASLGAVWAPCAGPVLGSILTLIAAAEHLDHAAAMLIFYTLGAALPMLAIAYGGQYASTHIRRIGRFTRPLQRGFGVVVVLIAAAMFFQYDSTVIVWLSNFYPGISTGL